MKDSFFTIGHLRWWRGLGLVLMVMALVAFKPYSAQAQTTVLSDDFSNGLTKWQPTRDDGTMWQIVNGAVEATVTKAATITELVPKDQYWSTEWKNITFSYDLTPLQGVDRNTSFGWESIKRWFEIHLVSGVLNLVRVEDGQVPLNIFDQYPMTNGQTYHVSITLQDQNISVKVNGELVTEATYQNYVSQGGKIGLKAGTGAVYPTKLRYDNVQVVWNKPADTQLSVPLFKQVDQLWKDLVYDHATTWSAQPTIGRYGCLVSSIAMVMNYHGLNKMADGALVTPAALNSWLTNQPDGFIGEGLVNWQAVTRLTKQLSDKFGTPKLEYSRVAGSGLTSTIDFIKKKYPSILEVSGHFLVGTGFTFDQKDVLINDPAYTYDKLSQHSSGLLSTRLLTPSHTDLSYLVVSHTEVLTVNVTKADGSAVTGLETFTEQLSADGGQPQTTKISVQQLAKPDTGEFMVTVSQPKAGPFKLTVYAYDQLANLTDLSLTGWVGLTPQRYTIQFQKTAGSSSTISSKIDWQVFRQVIAQTNASGSFLRKNMYDQLSSLVDHAEQEEPAKQLQRVKQLEKVLTAFNTNWLTPQTLNYLQHILQQLKASIAT